MERVRSGEGPEGQASGLQFEPRSGELQLRARGKLIKYECRRQHRGLKRDTAAESSHSPGAQRCWWPEPGEPSACLGNEAEAETDEEPEVEPGECPSAGPGPQRKSRGKRKNMEVSECERRRPTRGPAAKQKRRSKQRQGVCKRRAGDKGLPLKRTSGDTRVDRLLAAAQRAEGLASAPPPQQQCTKMRFKAWGRGAGSWVQVLGRRGWQSVCLADAQTQTESESPSSCSGPSTSESGADLGSECVGLHSSQTSAEDSSSTSSSSNRDSSQLSVAQGGSHCPYPAPSERRSVGLQAPEQPGSGPQDFKEIPPLCSDRTRGRQRRRLVSPIGNRAAVCSESPRGRRRRDAPRVTSCSSWVSQDTWGCLIF